MSDYEFDRSRIVPAGPGPAVRLTAGLLRLPGYMDILIDAPMHLVLEISHPVTSRIDTLYVADGRLCVSSGLPSFVAMPPTWPIGSHFVANILIRACAMTVYPDDINTDPNKAFPGYTHANPPTQRNLDRMAA